VRILHAPSDRFTKRSAAIEEIVGSLETQLRDRARVDLGGAHPEVLAATARAGIVIDQINAEVPGVFPAEAMALAKAVICEYDPRKLAPFAGPCPMAEASAGTLAARLRELVGDPPRHRGVGAAGRRHAASVHAPLSAAKTTEHVYRHSPRRERGVFEATAAGVRPIDVSVELPELAESPGRRRSVPGPQ
jgi:hypothetical protein